MPPQDLPIPPWWPRPPPGRYPPALAPSILPDGVSRNLVQYYLDWGWSMWDIGLAPDDEDNPDPNWVPHFVPPASVYSLRELAEQASADGEQPTPSPTSPAEVPAKLPQ